MKNDVEWHKIGIKLTNYFRVCPCQRKLKSIVDNLYSIYIKCIDAYDKGTPRDFTGAEWLLIALIDKNGTAITHCINCEYPIIVKDDPLWTWILEIKDSEFLEDS